MIRISKFWVFCCLQVSTVLTVADDIDADYYFGSSYEALRARDAVLDCNNPVNQLYCKFKCKNDPGVCFENKCYCVYEPKPDLPKQSVLLKGIDYTQRGELLRYNPYRRHHIAHFCPNLDEARKCIRKCMKEGKPAFCGKDHVCYCGHKYSFHQKEDKLDPEKIKAGFYELYEKYFGPDTTIMKKESTENNDDGKNHNAPPKKDPPKKDSPKQEGKSHEKEEGEGDSKHEEEEEEETADNKPEDVANEEDGAEAPPEDAPADEPQADEGDADEGDANEGDANEGDANEGEANGGEANGGEANEGDANEGEKPAEENTEDEETQVEEGKNKDAPEEENGGENTPEANPAEERRYFRRKVYKFSL